MRKNYTKQTPIRAFFLWTTTILCFSALFLSSCSKDEEPAPTLNILQIIDETEGLDSLSALLNEKDANDAFIFSGIITELQNTNKTFFAPNNEAFARLVNAIRVSSMAEIRLDLLRNILEYHIVKNAEALPVSKLTDGLATELGTETIEVNTSVNPVALNSSVQPKLIPTIVTGDIKAVNNGIIHVINNVLLPSTITTDISPTFGTLAGYLSIVSGFSEMDALVRLAGLRDELADSTKEYTVLGLYNSILDNYISSILGSTATVSNLNEQGALLIAGYHIMPGKPFEETILPSEVPTLLTDDPIYVAEANLSADLTIQLNYSAYLYDVGFKALNNGKIYIPVVVNNSGSLNLTALSSSSLRGTAVGYIDTYKDVDLGLLNQAVTLVPSVKDILEGDSPYTFFAPNDSAFAAAGITSDSLNTMPVATLEAILKNHILSGLVFAQDLNGTTKATLKGNTLSFAESTSGITITDQATTKTSKIVYRNFLTNKGVVHDVNKLLVP